MKIVVTGATGHVGVNMIRALHEKGFEVLANHLNGDKLLAMQFPEVQWIQGNVLDKAFLSRAFKGADVVIHLAARISISGDPRGEVMKTNIQGPANVAEACLENNVQKLIHFSSIHAFKFSGTDPIVNEDSPRADNTCFKYDQSKIGGERAVQEAISKGLDAVILNPTGILGPYNYWNSFTGQMLKDLYCGRIPALVKSGYNWVDARDLADATIKAITHGKTGKNYILAGHNLDIKSMAQMVHGLGGKKPPILSVSLGVAKIGLPILGLYSRLTKTPPLYTEESLEILKNYNPNISSERAGKDLGFSPRPIEETIKDSIDWYKEQGML
ncbi:MAG: NAD-dependent epimerase/dehydratase family protein [Saprospiraceae bacterium]|nr:NAD-dependent epimerase/dehydratase family protein [Saprospiraceae bacterium]MCB9325222.1 NAD-dependent epimerase/dehydratase family protein [Lewinellaceae bacterium]